MNINDAAKIVADAQPRRKSDRECSYDNGVADGKSWSDRTHAAMLKDRDHRIVELEQALEVARLDLEFAKGVLDVVV